MEHIKPFKCDTCDMSFGRKETLNQHISLIHTEDPKLVECPDCGETFKNHKELDTHIRQSHIVTDHQCPHCKIYCTTKHGLDKHIDSCLNIRNFKCLKCGEAFVQKIHLDAHMEHKHSDERNYKCEVEGCGMAFKSKRNLTNHMRSHSDERPYKCPYCEKDYKTLTPLRTHIFKKHPEEYKQENDSEVEE